MPPARRRELPRRRRRAGAGLFVAGLVIAGSSLAACGTGPAETTTAADDDPTVAPSRSSDSGSATGSDNDTAPMTPQTATGLPTVAGGMLDLGDLDGRDLVLWFWAPW